MTIVAVGFLFFVYFFDWIVYGRSKFTLVKVPNKIKCKSRSLPTNEATVCGAQDLNTRVQFQFDDSFFVVDTTHAFNDSQSTSARFLCLKMNKSFHDIRTPEKLTRSIQLGDSNVLLERPHGQSFDAPGNRLLQQ